MTKKEKQMRKRQTSFLFIIQQLTHMGRKVNGVYTVFFGKTLWILKLECSSPKKEWRVSFIKPPSRCQTNFEMSSFLLKTSHHQDMISSMERR